MGAKLVATNETCLRFRAPECQDKLCNDSETNTIQEGKGHHPHTKVHRHSRQEPCAHGLVRVSVPQNNNSTQSFLRSTSDNAFNGAGSDALYSEAPPSASHFLQHPGSNCRKALPLDASKKRPRHKTQRLRHHSSAEGQKGRFPALRGQSPHNVFGI